MARPDPHTAHAIQLRRTKVSALYLARYYQHEIAAKLGIGRPTVRDDLLAIHKEWAKDSIGNRGEWIDRELAAIDRLERIYHRSWLRSLKAAETREARTVTKSDGDTTQQKSKREEDRCGNPQFLEGVRWCINRRIELLGLDAEKRLKIDGLDGYAKMTDDELDRRLAIAESRLSRASGAEIKAPGAGAALEPAARPTDGSLS